MSVSLRWGDHLFSMMHRVKASIVMWSELHLAERVKAAVCR